MITRSSPDRSYCAVTKYGLGIATGMDTTTHVLHGIDWATSGTTVLTGEQCCADCQRASVMRSKQR